MIQITQKKTLDISTGNSLERSAHETKYVFTIKLPVKNDGKI
jgi:hypothetical protein